MIIRSKFLPAAVAFITCLIGSIQASAEEHFDTGAFLSSCVDFVPNVPLAVPMDAQCVSHGRKMCELAAAGTPADHCLLEVTKWMQNEISAKWMRLPADLRKGRDTPPKLEEMASDGMLSTLSLSTPDCETVQINGIPKQSLCDYSSALAGWHALRVLQRSAKAVSQ
ncbi:hypothetical protein J7426_08220 [Tropicibacter sp. R16_0]|uniref:hypothetical protein n=1 Tax=Tropicibacter sp. R16_0 TaxID=2821102 RepID=UPI001AD9B519|nr:hypothetical protein [Tropicibacter sp. R16_0]MBO9450234.1 hypothetical protein [Tropicibacter sp. R16_0]